MRVSEKTAEDLVAVLIGGTAAEKDELELARLKKLPLEEQLEVGIVLYEALLQQKAPKWYRNEGLAGVRTVADAQHFLDPNRQEAR